MKACFLAVFICVFQLSAPGEAGDSRWDLPAITGRAIDALNDSMVRQVPRPDRDKYWDELASLQIDLGELNAAQDAIEQIDDSSLRLRLLSRLARALSERGQLERAKNILVILAEDKSQQWEAATHLVEDLCEAGRVSEAITVVDQFAEESFGRFLWRSIADTAARLGDDALLRRCATHAGNDGPNCLLIASERLIKLGRKNEAETLAREALELQQSFNEQDNVETYSRAMRILIEVRGRDAAEDVLAAAPDQFDGILLNVAAINLARSGNISDAKELFRRSVESSPQSPPVVGLVEAAVSSSALTDVFAIMGEFAETDEWDSVLADGVFYPLMRAERYNEAFDAARRIRAADRRADLLLLLAEQVASGSARSRSLFLAAASEANQAIDQMTSGLPKAYRLAWASSVWAKHGFSRDARRDLDEAERLAKISLASHRRSAPTYEYEMIDWGADYQIKSALAYETLGDIDAALRRLDEVGNPSRRAAVRQAVLLRARRFEDVLTEALATNSPIEFQEAAAAVVDAGGADSALRFIEEHDTLESVTKACGLIGIARGIERLLRPDSAEVEIGGIGH